LEDGEVLTGSTLKYNPNDKSFFIIPLNPSDRSERIYINARCVKHVDQKRLLGRVLIDAKMINGEQLQSALERQAEHRNKRLGEILLEKELISKRQLDESLNKQKERTIMLGEILIEAGYISKDQLDKALVLQKENRKKRLGQILVELKYVTPGDICVALASQLGCSWIDLSTVKIREEILGLLPRGVILQYEVIPVEKKNDEILVLASAQPRDPDMRQAVSRETPYKIDFVVAYDGHITAALAKYFTSARKENSPGA